MRTETLDPLQSPPPAIGLAKAEEISERLFGIAGALTPLPSERDLNFRVDDARGASFLLKLQNPADDAAVVEMQTEAIGHVARHEPSLPVMRIVPTGGLRQWTGMTSAKRCCSRQASKRRMRSTASRSAFESPVCSL